jgi:chaperonin GroES
MEIRPLYDRLIVKPEEFETTTKGGIVLPESVNKDNKPMRGKVIAIGKGKFIDGKVIPLDVKVGDDVLFGKYAGTGVKLEDGIEYLVMREEDVMGIIQ